MCSGRLSASCAAPPVGSALPEGRLAAEGERMPGRAPPLIERPLQFSAHRSSALLVPNLPEGRLAGPWVKTCSVSLSGLMDGGFAAILALRWGIALPSLAFRSMSMPSARQRNRLG